MASLSVAVEDASETIKGITQYATPAETLAGLINNKSVTPAALSEYIMATNSEIMSALADLQPRPGIHWEPSPAPPGEWASVAYGNGLFAAVSSRGLTNQVITSPDAKNWNAATIGNYSGYTGLVFGSGLFVATRGGHVKTSPDGIVWTQRTLPGSGYECLAYGNGIFVATGAGTNSTVTSPDSIEWTLHTGDGGLQIVFTNGMFIMGDVNMMVKVSTNGIDWTNKPSTPKSWTYIAHGKGIYVAVGVGCIMTSPDLAEWTVREAPPGEWVNVAYANGLFVATAAKPYYASSDTGNRVMTSPDGITWTIRQATSSNTWNSTCWANGIFVAVGDNCAMTSGI
jgi:hypothetical protein